MSEKEKKELETTEGTKSEAAKSEKKTEKKGESKWKKSVEASRKWFRELKSEFKKIVWPNFSTVVKNTGVVLAMCAVTAVVIVVVDALCGWLVNLLVNMKL